MRIKHTQPNPPKEKRTICQTPLYQFPIVHRDSNIIRFHIVLEMIHFSLLRHKHIINQEINHSISTLVPSPQYLYENNYFKVFG